MTKLIGHVKATSMRTKAIVVEGIKPCCYQKKIKNRVQKPAAMFELYYIPYLQHTIQQLDFTKKFVRLKVLLFTILKEDPKH